MTGWRDLPAYVLVETAVERDGDLVRLPYRLPDGGLYAYRVVAETGRRWWEPGDGRPVIPFGLDRLADPSFRRYRSVLVCEGESDALASYAALGHLGVDVIGVPGAGTWRPEWSCHVVGYAAVYVAGDGDDAGRRLNWAVRRDTGAVIVDLADGDDVRTVVQRDGGDELLDLLAGADQTATAVEAWDASASFDEYAARLEELQRVA